MTGILSTPTQLIGEFFSLIYRGAPDHETHVFPDAMLALSGDAGDYWLNTSVIGDGPGAESALRHAATTLRERSLPGWFIHDDALTNRLAPVAQDAGLDDGGTAPFMVYRPEAELPLPPSGDLAVEKISDQAGLSDANSIVAEAFASPRDAIDRVWGPLLLETPGLDIFLGRREGEAICVVMTMRHGPVIGIWTMGTLPERQRTGAGRQLLTSVVRHHLQLGTVAFYLVAFEAGKRLYDQVGFRTESEMHLWIAPGACP